MNTRIIAAQEERHYTSTCLYGRVIDIQRSAHADGVVLIELDPQGDMRRTLVARSEEIHMFPPFLIGRQVAVMCRPQVHETYFSLYGFTALADVDDLTEREADVLWWWRRDALDCLCDETFQMTRFEEELCDSMSSWGTPPTPSQRRGLAEVVRQRTLRPPRRTLDTMHRAARYDIVLRDGGPVALRDGMAEFLDWMMKTAGRATSTN